MDFKHEELKMKIEKELGTGSYLGNYNPEKRREAVLNKIREYLEDYQESTNNEPDPTITDPIQRKLHDIENKVKKLETAVGKFQGTHFNVKFRQLVEQCTNYQIELNFGCEDKDSDRNRRMALTKLNEISDRLFAKIHVGEKCANCS